jgi:hypothetical protein
MDKFKGDSVGKKLARLIGYYLIQTISGLGRGSRWGYLTSSFGGDVRPLSALGVPRFLQTGFERRPKSANDFHASFPDIDLRRGDIFKSLRATSDRFHALWLDFCGPMTPDQAAHIATAATYVEDGGILAHTVMRGREHGEMLARFKQLKAEYPENASPLDDPRIKEYQRIITASTQRALYPVFNITYHSRKNGKGTPFLIQGFMVGQKPSPRPHQDSILHNGKTILDTVDEFGVRSIDLSKAKENVLVDLSYALGARKIDSAEALNVSSQTLAALRAHDTRGSYGSRRSVVEVRS